MTYATPTGQLAIAIDGMLDEHLDNGATKAQAQYQVLAQVAVELFGEAAVVRENVYSDGGRDYTVTMGV